ncbi:MAG: hypothetical protein ACLQPD_19255 [Desulfomonilaceae bacterium]
MVDIHTRAEAIREKGLQEIKLPFESLILAARHAKIVTFKIGTRKDLSAIIRGFLTMFPGDTVMIGILDPSGRGFPVVVDNSGFLVVSRDQDVSENFLDDFWVVQRSFFEHQVACRPDFLKLSTNFINVFGYIQMLKNSPNGHC